MRTNDPNTHISFVVDARRSELITSHHPRQLVALYALVIELNESRRDAGRSRSDRENSLTCEFLARRNSRGASRENSTNFLRAKLGDDLLPASFRFLDDRSVLHRAGRVPAISREFPIISRRFGRSTNRARVIINDSKVSIASSRPNAEE